jgi:chemosensory pili system protein ChpA (sensor histidine kinase/response regulator)
MDGFKLWIEDIAGNNEEHWRALPFRQAAERLRLENVSTDLIFANGAESVDMTEAPEVPELPLVSPHEEAVSITETVDFSSTLVPSFGDTELTEHGDAVTLTTNDDEKSTQGDDVTERAEATQPVEIDLLDLSFGDVVPGNQEAVQDLQSELEGSEEFLNLDDLLHTQPLQQVEPICENLSEVSPVEADTEFLPEAEAVLEPKDETELTVEVEASPELPTETDAEMDEQVKVIGSLRIGIPLYNVYLNEADEWSRRLLTELTEWSMELERPAADSTIGLAHSLAGSSATVGFMALSELARALEHALEHTRFGQTALAVHVQLFVDVAEDIRRLLHQFAAGFLKQPDSDLLLALKAVLETDFDVVTALEHEDEEFDSLKEPLADVLVAQTVDEVTQPIIQSAVEQTSSTASLDEDDIEAVDTLDVDLFPIFEEEALDLLPKLSGALRQWSEHPDDVGARQETLRVLHTLKGSARLAGAMRLGEMAHSMESAVEQINSETVQAVELDPLLTRLDRISACFEVLRATPAAALVLPEAGTVAPAMSQLPASAEGVSGAAAQTAEQNVSVSLAPMSSVASMSPVLPLRRASGQTIRVKSQLIDRMVNQAGEVMISRSRLESRLGQLRGSLDELTGNLERLRRQLRDIELQSESQMQSRLAQTKDSAQSFDPLEFDRFTRVQELTRMMAESVHDVATLQRNLQQTVEGVEDDLIAQARQTRELQRDLLRTRMVEFESISERLYGVVRQAAKDFDKPVKLDIVGGSLDMDRGVLERVASAFEHLLRNAVGHGIEAAPLRAAAGKPSVGSIAITVEQQSNDVAVTFSDDGAGLDLARIREKALAQGQITAEQVLSDEQVANLIFASGLSTASEVSEMAGRGIGMDVVRNEVNALGGRIELSTQHGQGTQFKLVLPLTTAVTQVVLLRMGDVVMGVPASLVELVRRVPPVELDAAYQAGRFDYNGDGVAFFWAGALLQTSRASEEARGRTSAVAIFRSAGQRVAMHVDEVLGNQEVVVKNLGPQLARIPGLAGMSVLASGAVVLIYNPVAMVATHGEQARAYVEAGAASETATLQGVTGTGLPMTVNQLPLVLVVDDSITVRRVTQRLLKREGFRVALASDGLHALELLQVEKPSVVLTDIEMPRMDGFDLVRNIRGDARLQDLPIIMITSRIAEKHREYARALNVDHYLGKPYPEDELIALVRGYCAVELSV